MAHLKTQAKLGLFVIGGLIVFFALRTMATYGIIPTPGFAKALVPPRFVLPDVKDAEVQNVAPVALPGASAANVQATLIRGEIWEWNAQMGALFANGGASTTAGSLMAKHNVNLSLVRQDDTTQMQNDLIACAKELHDGAQQCSSGANFAIIMGDGSGQFAAAVNPQLAKLGPAYKVKVIGSTGYSRGEDAFLAPPNVKQKAKSFVDTPMPGSRGKNGQEITGLLVEGVLRDGDWNIAEQWAASNDILNNPDEHTYNPDAMNWVNAPDYNTAAADYVGGSKCEDRPVVKGGHPTGEQAHVCVNAIVTWTPGDVVAVTKRGGLVKVVSSKQYRSQMPAVVIGPGKFFADNRDEVTGMIAAICEGGDQVKAFDQSLKKAALISSEVYHDEGDPASKHGDFWYRYYKGVQQRDSQGNQVELGGSAVNNLADNLILFGIQQGSNDNFRSTYTLFAAMDVQQYPTLFKETPIPSVTEVEDKSFLTGAQAVLSGQGDTGSDADAPSFADSANGSVIGKKAYSISFNTGSAQLTSDGSETVKQLKDSIALTDAFVKIDGFTDNTGSDSVNIPLSRNRAAAVANYLHRLAPHNFPTDGLNVRFKIDGHGSQDPVADNTTADGKAHNRRVEITLVSKSN